MASVLAPVSNLTATTTMFGSGVALAAQTTMTLAPTTNPISPLPLRTTTMTDVLTTLTATLQGSSTITPAASFTGSANAPNIVIGNLTITPNGNPIGLPFILGNATAITVSTGPGATGTGYVISGNFTGNTSSNATIPFVGDAYSWRSGTSLWGSSLLVFLLAIGWIL